MSSPDPRMRGTGKRSAWLVLPPLVIMAGCADAEPVPYDAQAHAQEVAEWQEWRHGTLVEPDGWLTLVALHWLDDPVTRMGSSADAELLYEASETPELVGQFVLDERGGVADSANPSQVMWESAPGVRVTHAGNPVDRLALHPVDSGPVVLESGSLQWFVIRRGDRLAVRMRDTLSAVRTGFEGMDNFALTGDLRLPARFEWHDPPDTIPVPNILGSVNPTPSPASVVFEYEGDEFRLALWKDSDDPVNFFTAFADDTNGETTYGGGRFLWIDAPDEDGMSVVDFNRAYNPPCVFTPYATCPLPPRQNRLSFPVEAGERSFKASS